MTTCPACAGSRVTTAVASRATGRRISTCRDCGVRFWSDHRARERMDAIVELTSLGATRYGGNWSYYRERKALELASADICQRTRWHETGR